MILEGTKKPLPLFLAGCHLHSTTPTQAKLLRRRAAAALPRRRGPALVAPQSSVGAPGPEFVVLAWLAVSVAEQLSQSFPLRAKSS